MNRKKLLIIKLIVTYLLLIGVSVLLYCFLTASTKDADKVNLSIGLLGWSATLFAPIAAFFLLDNWKEQTKYNAKLEFIAEMLSEFSELSQQIDEICTNTEVSVYLMRSVRQHNNKEIQTILGDKIKEYALPDFSKIYKHLENLRVLNLKIYIYDDEINSHAFMSKTNGHDSYDQLENCIKGLDAAFFRIKHDKASLELDPNSAEFQDFLQKCFYINLTFYNHYRSNYDPSVENKYNKNLNISFNNVFEDIKNFRKSLK